MSNSHKLSGSLGVGSIVLMVVATAAPLTVMVANTPLIISMGNGPAAPFDAFIAAVIMLLFCIGFVAMSKYITNAGAFYAYIQKGLGKCIGLGSATTSLFSYLLILIALEGYIGYAINDLIRNFTGVSAPWQIYTFLTIALVGFLGYRHIELSSKFLGVALILEILVVLAVNGAIIFDKGLGDQPLAPFYPSTIASGSPGLGIMFAIFSYIGIEATAIFRDEAKNPEKTIPIATYIAVTIVGIFYTVSMWCEVQGIGFNQILAFANAHPGDMYLLMTQQYLNKVFYDVMQVLLVTSVFACILSLHNIVVRYQYTLGRFGVLPEKIARVHPKFHSPYISSFTQTIVSVIALALMMLAGLDPVTQIYAWGATAGTLGYMFILSLTCISIIAFFYRTKLDKRVWNTVIAPLGGFIGMFLCLIITIENLPALVGAESSLVPNLIKLIIVVAFLIGFIGALLIRKHQPKHYEALGDVA